MKIYDWNKLSLARKKSLQKKKTIFIAGPRTLSKIRIQQIYNTAARKFGNPDTILIGHLKDEFIVGLENSPQFKTADLKILQSIDEQEKIKTRILSYFQRDIDHVISELKPNLIFWIYGSWSGFIHYKPEFWSALEYGAIMEFVSPFANEEEGEKIEKQITTAFTKRTLFNSYKNYSPSQFMQLTHKIKTQSWAWEKQTGAVLVKNGKVILTGFNIVLPHQWHQMHYGNMREDMRVASQEKVELHQTLHAEMMILTEAIKQKIQISDCEMYVDLFPCAHCAKILAHSGIKKITYQTDHSHDFGYKVLQESGVILSRLVV